MTGLTQKLSNKTGT